MICRTSRVVLLACVVLPLFFTNASAQSEYVLRKVQGQLGLFKKPTDRKLHRGQLFWIKRRHGAETVIVGKGRIEYIGNKVCGVRLITFLADKKLKLGDYLSEINEKKSTGRAQSADEQNSSQTSTPEESGEPRPRRQGEGAPQVEFGYLRLHANVPSFFVAAYDNFRRSYYLTTGDSIPLVEGSHNITVAIPYSSDARFTVTIKKGETLNKNIFFGEQDVLLDEKKLFAYNSYSRMRWRANLVVVTDDGSEILINGRLIGHDVVKLDTLAGWYKIVARHPHAGSSEQLVLVKDNRLTYVELYNKPEKHELRRRSYVPGRSQFYRNDKWLGSAFVAGTVVPLILAVRYQATFLKKETDYRNFLWAYRTISEQQTAFDAGVELQEKYELARAEQRKRNTALFIAGAVYLLNILDAFRKPKSGYRVEKPLRSWQRIEPAVGNHSIGLNWSFGF